MRSLVTSIVIALVGFVAAPVAAQGRVTLLCSSNPE
jgi:hypothetical protein